MNFSVFAFYKSGANSFIGFGLQDGHNIEVEFIGSSDEIIRLLSNHQEFVSTMATVHSLNAL